MNYEKALGLTQKSDQNTQNINMSISTSNIKGGNGKARKKKALTIIGLEIFLVVFLVALLFFLLTIFFNN